MARPEHLPTGDPCTKCGMAAERHRRRVRPGDRHDPSRRAAYRQSRRVAGLERQQEFIIGIDGEGKGRKPHRYFYLCAAGEDGRIFDVEDDKGLTTEACLEFLVSLPSQFSKVGRSIAFGYSLTYDYTKIMQDLPDDKLYALFHEQVSNEGRIKPVYWRQFKLVYMNRRLTIARGFWWEGEDHRRFARQQSITIWDIFRFYQGPFTAALADWKTGGQDVIDWIKSMKEQRYKLDELPLPKVRHYCQDECHLLVKLGRQLIRAHEDAGLPLKQFFGAGSTGAAMLHRMGVKQYNAACPSSVQLPVAKAFFGGRFENSIIGFESNPVINYDISSAYPYHIHFLPCLAHGKWEYVTSPSLRLLGMAQLAVCHVEYEVDGAWGPFPFRLSDGTIVFPLSATRSQDCWVWFPEYQSAKTRWGTRVRCVAAHVYHQECDHQPFSAIPEFYRERIRIGKDGPGIVLKLGMNSEYGKLAQSKGHNPPFQSWVWAGNITSGTRAQLLEAIPENGWDLLSMATDGITTRIPLGTLPRPRKTNTSDTGKPLGGWESKTYHDGMFYARPGIYFPLNATPETLKEVRARGLGKKVVYECWRELVAAYESGDNGFTVHGYTDTETNRWIPFERFIGAKTGITRSGDSYKRSADYGEFVRWPIEVAFGAAPKRSHANNGRLIPWHSAPGISTAYNPAVISSEARMLREFTEIVEEQPDLTYG